MTSIEKKTVSSHFESDICRELAELSINSSQFMKDIQRRDNNTMQLVFNDSLFKVNSSTEGAALCRRQFQALGT